MKKLCILFTALILMLSGFVSCSNLTQEEENSSLTLSFNGSDFSRNITVPSDTKDFYLVVNVLGDYKETKEITFSSFGSYSLTFDSIPIGAEIYVEANAYNPNAAEPNGTDYPTIFHTFTGDSSKQRIHEGENGVNLQMKNLQNIKLSETIQVLSSSEYDGRYKELKIWDDFKICFYSNGKYKIMKKIQNQQNQYQTVSEGLYTGHPVPGNTIELKEFIYRNIDHVGELNGGVNISFGNSVIVDNPQSISVYMGEEICYFRIMTNSQMMLVFREQV